MVEAPRSRLAQLEQENAELKALLERSMDVHECDGCGWEYYEAKGHPPSHVPPFTKYRDLPGDFACPRCSTGKYYMFRLKGKGSDLPARW